MRGDVLSGNFVTLAYSHSSYFHVTISPISFPVPKIHHVHSHSRGIPITADAFGELGLFHEICKKF